MIVMSLVAMRMAEKNGYWLVLLVSFLSLPICGFVAAHMITNWGVFPVEMLQCRGGIGYRIDFPALQEQQVICQTLGLIGVQVLDGVSDLSLRRTDAKEYGRVGRHDQLIFAEQATTA